MELEVRRSEGLTFVDQGTPPCNEDDKIDSDLQGTGLSPQWAASAFSGWAGWRGENDSCAPWACKHKWCQVISQGFVDTRVRQVRIWPHTPAVSKLTHLLPNPPTRPPPPSSQTHKPPSPTTINFPQSREVPRSLQDSPRTQRTPKGRTLTRRTGRIQLETLEGSFLVSGASVALLFLPQLVAGAQV